MPTAQALQTITALPIRRPRRESQKARHMRLWLLRLEFRELKEAENPNLTPSELCEKSVQYIKAIQTLEDLHPR